MDHDQAIKEIGIRDIYYYPGHEGRIDDVELAHEMALAMDPQMDKVLWAKDFQSQLLQAPDETYRRMGKKAEIFDELVQAQKIEDDRMTGSNQALPHYIRYKNEAYTKRITEDRTARAKRITNGFVAEFVMGAADRYERAANKAAELVFFKQRERENIAIFEQHLTQREQAVFARLEPREEDDATARWADGDEEVIALNNRSNELWDIFRKKLAVEAVAQTFGRRTTRGFSREDMVALAAVIKDDYMIEA